MIDFRCAGLPSQSDIATMMIKQLQLLMDAGPVSAVDADLEIAALQCTSAITRDISKRMKHFTGLEQRMLMLELTHVSNR